MARSRAAVTTALSLLGVLALVAGCAGYAVRQPSASPAALETTATTTAPPWWWPWWWSWPPPSSTTTTTPGTTPTTTPSPSTTTPGPIPGGQPVGFGRATTGGAGGQVVTVTSAGALADAAGGTERRVIRISGTIQIDGMVRIGSNKTLEGVGGGGRLVGGGLNIREATNVIVRNLSISGSDDDNINVETSTNVWIDHNDLSGASDGALDIKRASDNVTVSWNHFHDQDKTALLGHSDDNASQDRGRLRVTYHHNWFDGTGQRHPRVRFGNPVHVFNNYYSDIGDYGVASTIGSGVLVEANYFENVEDPYHLGEGDSPDGALVARGNHMVNSGSGQTGGSVAPIPYAYTPHAAASVKSIVTAGAGVQG